MLTISRFLRPSMLVKWGRKHQLTSSIIRVAKTLRRSTASMRHLRWLAVQVSKVNLQVDHLCSLQIKEKCVLVSKLVLIVRCHSIRSLMRPITLHSLSVPPSSTKVILPSISHLSRPNTRQLSYGTMPKSFKTVLVTIHQANVLKQATDNLLMSKHL